jgi:hypothetical protein
MRHRNPREHFIPLRKSELIELLCAGESLPEEDREPFRHFCRVLSATYHFHFNQRFEELKAAYAPFDPDRDTQPLIRWSAEEKQQRLNELYRDFAWLLERGNFIHLCREDIEPCLQETSDWGIHMQVDFGAFEHLAIFARGDVLQKRTRRRLRKLYRLEETQVPTYQRLVMILKLKPDERHADVVNTERVYLKIFKDIPKLDLKMLLPTARVHLSLLDRGKIGFPFLSGLGATLFNIADDLFPKLIGLANNPTLLLWGIASGGHRLRLPLVVRLSADQAALQPDADAEPLLPEPRQQRRRALPPARRGRGAGVRRGPDGLLLPLATRARAGLDRPRSGGLH